jgi:hypothetical protein
MILDGAGQAQIRGSDVWSKWTLSDRSWVSTLTLPIFNTSHQGICADGTTRCNWPEQVYQDGTPLVQVGVGKVPTTGQFSVDTARHVVLGEDPTGHLMEVTTRERWVDTESDTVTIQNFTFAHAANAAQTGAVGNQNRDGWTLQDSKLY